MGKSKAGGLSPRTALSVELNGASQRMLREGETFESVVSWARDRADGDTDVLLEEAAALVATWMHGGNPSALVAAAAIAKASDRDTFVGDQVMKVYDRMGRAHSAPGPGSG